MGRGFLLLILYDFHPSSLLAEVQDGGTGWIEISFTALLSYNLSRTLFRNTLIQFRLSSDTINESY